MAFVVFKYGYIHHKHYIDHPNSNRTTQIKLQNLLRKRIIQLL